MSFCVAVCLFLFDVYPVYFQSLKHNHNAEEENKVRMNQLKSSLHFMKQDGLNSLKYKLNRIAEHQDYTHVYVDLLRDKKG